MAGGNVVFKCRTEAAEANAGRFAEAKRYFKYFRLASPFRSVVMRLLGEADAGDILGDDADVEDAAIQALLEGEGEDAEVVDERHLGVAASGVAEPAGDAAPPPPQALKVGLNWNNIAGQYAAVLPTSEDYMDEFGQFYKNYARVAFGPGAAETMTLEKAGVLLNRLLKTGTLEDAIGRMEDLIEEKSSDPGWINGLLGLPKVPPAQEFWNACAQEHEAMRVAALSVISSYKAQAEEYLAAEQDDLVDGGGSWEAMDGLRGKIGAWKIDPQIRDIGGLEASAPERAVKAAQLHALVQSQQAVLQEHEVLVQELDDDSFERGTGIFVNFAALLQKLGASLQKTMPA